MDSYILLYWYIGSVLVFRLSILVYIGSVQNFSIGTPLTHTHTCSHVHTAHTPTLRTHPHCAHTHTAHTSLPLQYHKGHMIFIQLYEDAQDIAHSCMYTHTHTHTHTHTCYTQTYATHTHTHMSHTHTHTRTHTPYTHKHTPYTHKQTPHTHTPHTHVIHTQPHATHTHTHTPLTH